MEKACEVSVDSNSHLSTCPLWICVISTESPVRGMLAAQQRVAVQLECTFPLTITVVHAGEVTSVDEARTPH